MKTQLIKYIRKNGNPVGCFIAIKSQDDGVRIGWSKYSKLEEKSFSKEEAKKLALSRSKTSFLFTMHEEWNTHWKDWSMTIVPNFPPSMRSELLEFNERVFKFFKVDEIQNYMFTKTHDKEKVQVGRLATGGWVTFDLSTKGVGGYIK
ncbi:MAG: hypothetical protein WC055_00970 [Melioribacteraceae bacterium]